MGKTMRMTYDEEGDILDVSLGKPEAAVSREVEDDFFVRLHPSSGEVVGFSILNFRKWFRDANDSRTLPVEAQLAVS